MQLAVAAAPPRSMMNSHRFMPALGSGDGIVTVRTTALIEAEAGFDRTPRASHNRPTNPRDELSPPYSITSSAVNEQLGR